jgi:hypothetical protein
MWSLETNPAWMTNSLRVLGFAFALFEKAETGARTTWEGTAASRHAIGNSSSAASAI